MALAVALSDRTVNVCSPAALPAASLVTDPDPETPSGGAASSCRSACFSLELDNRAPPARENASSGVVGSREMDRPVRPSPSAVSPGALPASKGPGGRDNVTRMHAAAPTRREVEPKPDGKPAVAAALTSDDAATAAWNVSTATMPDRLLVGAGPAVRQEPRAGGAPSAAVGTNQATPTQHAKPAVVALVQLHRGTRCAVVPVALVRHVHVGAVCAVELLPGLDSPATARGIVRAVQSRVPGTCDAFGKLVAVQRGVSVGDVYASWERNRDVEVTCNKRDAKLADHGTVEVSESGAHVGIVLMAPQHKSHANLAELATLSEACAADVHRSKLAGSAAELHALWWAPNAPDQFAYVRVVPGHATRSRRLSAAEFMRAAGIAPHDAPLRLPEHDAPDPQPLWVRGEPRVLEAPPTRERRPYGQFPSVALASTACGFRWHQIPPHLVDAARLPGAALCGPCGTGFIVTVETVSADDLSGFALAASAVFDGQDTRADHTRADHRRGRVGDALAQAREKTRQFKKALKRFAGVWPRCAWSGDATVTVEVHTCTTNPEPILPAIRTAALRMQHCNFFVVVAVCVTEGLVWRYREAIERKQHTNSRS